MTISVLDKNSALSGRCGKPECLSAIASVVLGSSSANSGVAAFPQDAMSITRTLPAMRRCVKISICQLLKGDECCLSFDLLCSPAGVASEFTQRGFRQSRPWQWNPMSDTHSPGVISNIPFSRTCPSRGQPTSTKLTICIHHVYMADRVVGCLVIPRMAYCTVVTDDAVAMRRVQEYRD